MEEDPSKEFPGVGNARTILSLYNSPYLVVDYETNGKDFRWDKKAFVTGVSLSGKDIPGKYYPLNHKGWNLPKEKYVPILKDLIEDHPRVVVHGANVAEIPMGKSLDINIEDSDYYCTMVGTHWINENLQSKSLDYVSQHYGGEPKYKDKDMERIIKNYGWEYVPVDLMSEYGPQDANLTGMVYEKTYPTFKREEFAGPLWERERKFIKLILKMETIGIPLDVSLCESEIAFGEDRMEQIKKELGGLNPNSPNDMEELFIRRLGLPVHHRTPNGDISFDKDAMEYYDMLLARTENTTARLTLEYRGWNKTISSNYRPYLQLKSDNDTLHPNYNHHKAVTTRTSAERPALQQIPQVSPKRWNGRLKKAFVARLGYMLWDFDFASVEMRVSACYGKDRQLLETFNNGRNLFNDMSELMQRPKKEVKTRTYAILFGAGAKRLSDITGDSLSESKKYIDEFFNVHYSGIGSFKEFAEETAKETHYLKLWTGRRRHFGRFVSTHLAFNSVIQGGAAEIMKSTMLRLDEAIDWDECKMLLTVHDSVVFEIKIGTEEKWHRVIKMIMQDVRALHPLFERCPFPVEGKVWGSDEKDVHTCRGCEAA